MSTFDITSDLVNSLDFLGHNASAKIVGATFGTSGASTNNNGTTMLKKEIESQNLKTFFLSSVYF